MSYLRLLLRPAIALALAALVGPVLGCSPNRAAFRGYDLTERESGINVTVSQDRGIIAVTSARYHYSIMLPYADNWDFSWNSENLLLGKSGGINVTLNATVTEESALDHLKKLRAAFRARGAIPGLESARILKHRGEFVLVTVVDGASATETQDLRGVKHLNVFAVRKLKKALYRLHLSTPYIDGKDTRSVLEEYLDYATAGFSVSFMREHMVAEDELGIDTPWRRGGARRR